MSKFSNLLRLLMILKSKGRVKSKELADALGVSERMIRKYISDLYDSGIVIESVSGPTGGYELVGYEYLLNLNITDEEMTAFRLLVKNNYLDSFNENPYIKSLEDKLFVQKNLNTDYNDFSSNITLNSKVANLQMQNRIEQDLYVGIVFSKKVKVNYTSLTSGESERIIHPYKIIMRNNVKYIICFCENRDKILTLKLIRFSKVQVLDEKFVMPDKSQLESLMKDKLGIMGNDDIKVKLHIKKPFSYTVKERIYASDQVIIDNDDESIIFKASFRGKEDVIRWILSMKSYVTVLEPETLRGEIVNELKKMLEVYKIVLN